MQEKNISLIASGCCETTCMNVVSQAQCHSTKLCRLFLSAYNRQEANSEGPAVCIQESELQ